jgi:hypothetical protein
MNTIDRIGPELERPDASGLARGLALLAFGEVALRSGAVRLLAFGEVALGAGDVLLLALGEVALRSLGRVSLACGEVALRPMVSHVDLPIVEYESRPSCASTRG